jgi:hypothetical protein
MSLVYQYGQNFDLRDHGGYFVAHPGEWLTVRFPQSKHLWKLAPLPEGFILDMEFEEELNEDCVKVLSVRVDELKLAAQSGGRWWNAWFDVVPG